MPGAPVAQRALHRTQGGADQPSSSRGFTPVDSTDIRYDEDYARFYEAYSGQKKLPPPVEGRTLYNELPGLLQQKQLQAAQQAALLGSATPPPQAAMLMGGLTPAGAHGCHAACSGRTVLYAGEAELCLASIGAMHTLGIANAAPPSCVCHHAGLEVIQEQPDIHAGMLQALQQLCK